MSTEESSPILFFDGECGLCHGLVLWLARRDAGSRLRYAPLQGATAASLLSPEETRDLDSVILLLDGRIHRRSEAALRALGVLGGGWRVASCLRLLPRGLRDAAYRFVARRRHRMRRSDKGCALPPSFARRLLP